MSYIHLLFISTGQAKMCTSNPLACCLLCPPSNCIFICAQRRRAIHCTSLSFNSISSRVHLNLKWPKSRPSKENVSLSTSSVASVMNIVTHTFNDTLPCYFAVFEDMYLRNAGHKQVDLAKSRPHLQYYIIANIIFICFANYGICRPLITEKWIVLLSLSPHLL